MAGAKANPKQSCTELGFQHVEELCRIVSWRFSVRAHMIRLWNLEKNLNFCCISAQNRLRSGVNAAATAGENPVEVQKERTTQQCVVDTVVFGARDCSGLMHAGFAAPANQRVVLVVMQLECKL